MGFHPFSDGLPYAPTRKTPTTGTGATVAGRPQFARENPISTGTVKTRTTRTSVYSPGSIQPKFDLSPPEPVRPKMNTEQVNEKLVIRRRFFAYLLDTAIHAGFWLLTNLAALLLFQFELDLQIFQERWPEFLGFFLISQWMFIALQEMLFENSLGKSFFHLEFRRNHRSLLLRSAVFMLGLICFGLGSYFRWQDYFGKITLRSKTDHSNSLDPQ
jgi:hypothetical protein